MKNFINQRLHINIKINEWEFSPRQQAPDKMSSVWKGFVLIPQNTKSISEAFNQNELKKQRMQRSWKVFYFASLKKSYNIIFYITNNITSLNTDKVSFVYPNVFHFNFFAKTGPLLLMLEGCKNLIISDKNRKKLMVKRQQLFSPNFKKFQQHIFIFFFIQFIIFYNCYSAMSTELIQNFREVEQEAKAQPISKNKFFINFILYSVSYLIYGQVFTCLGPMFPYLSASEGRLQTQYSFLYTCRALGYMSGSLLIKLLQEKLTLHHIISLGVGQMGISGILFSFLGGIWLKGICIFFSSVGGAFQDIAINLAVLQCFANSNSAIWLQIVHGIFGIGGLTGPFAVYFFELKTLAILGFMSLCAIIFYFYLPTPQTQHKALIQNQEYFKKFRHIPGNSLMLISSTFFFTLGQETSYGGWISSYAVLNHFSTKEHATLYSSLYWVSITVFRFVFAFVPGSSSKKIQYLGLIGVCNSVTGYYLIFYVDSQFGLNFMSIMFGFCNSALFPLLLTIPQQFGFKFTMQETATFITWSALGQGCLAVGIGKMMGLISYNWLIYGMLVMDLIITVLCRANQLQMINQKERLDRELNQKLLEGTQMKEIQA